MSVRVKICGITSVSDAKAAVEAGADALGFVFAEGLRRIEAAQAAKIIATLPPFVARVGVFVNESLDALEHTVRSLGLSFAQLHGDEDAAYVRRASVPVVKVFRAKGPEIVKEIRKAAVSSFYLDTWSDAKRGGTGKTFDWKIAREAAKLGHLVLAGGLTPDNVADAVREVRPHAVDVSSGVESAPGKKDIGKVRRFIEEARRAAP